MMALKTGRVSVFATEIILLVIFMIYLRQARKKIPPVRNLPPIDAIEEGVGRCVEQGRPVHWTPGYGRAEHAGGLGSASALGLLGGVTILGYTATLCAQRGAELICTFANPELVPLATDVVRQAYTVENKLDDFKPDNMIFVSSRQFTYSTGVLGIMQRANIGFNLMTGAFSAEGLIFAEGGNTLGAFQVAGASGQLEAFVPICDYTLIGEEFYAAASYISGDPVQRGTLRGIDVFKIIIIILMIAGFLLQPFGIFNFSKLLSM